MNQINPATGLKEGFWVEKFDNGRLRYEGVYVNGERDGRWWTFYSTWNLVSEGVYINGKIDGFNRLYKNGSLYETTFYASSKIRIHFKVNDSS